MDRPFVSIVVDNFNYGHYLAEAIDSALQQDYDATEVVVVDDGSTDNSHEIIDGYGDRIVAIHQENGGQAAALNAGFARTKGDIVIFLDADDRLLPATAKQVAAIFGQHPRIARVHYRVEVIDRFGTPSGWVIPPAYIGMANGDLRAGSGRMGNYGWPPTSGNAFSKWSLDRIFPLPEQDLSVSADYYLLRANALTGPIMFLDGAVGAQYRLHGNNSYYANKLSVDQLRRYLDLVRRCHSHLKVLALALGYNDYPQDPADLVDAFLLAHRLAVLRLDDEPGEMRQDGRWSLMWRGMAAAVQRPDRSLVKLLSAAWFVGMALSPKPVAGVLAEVFLNPRARRWLEGLSWRPSTL